MRIANDWVLNHFDWLFNYTSFAMVIVSVLIYVSPIGKVKIGGENAEPMLNKWRWFSIILCTTVAVGILFWGTAEPMFHLTNPPAALDIEALSAEAGSFAMGTMYLHWSFTPYAIYAIPSVLFALAYYNRGKSFSLGSMLFPFSKASIRPGLNHFINMICLFALVAGMSASLGAGMLSMNGGLSKFIDVGTSPVSLGLIALIVVLTFTVSSSSGLLRGIRFLSSLNMLIFIVLMMFIFIFGPIESIVSQACDGLQVYASNFIDQSLSLGQFSDSQWTHDWTTFYWANWMAWAPVTALFLGRISYGYTVRQFMLFNWVIPAVFSIIWMSIFSGTVIHQELQNQLPLAESLANNGPESVVYQMMNGFPLTELISVVFLFTMFISYVTAADSNTMAMSGLSSTGISPDSPEPSIWVQITWGVFVGVISWVMVSYSGVKGIKILSNLGGLPSLFLLIACTIGMVILIVKSIVSTR